MEKHVWRVYRNGHCVGQENTIERTLVMVNDTMRLSSPQGDVRIERYIIHGEPGSYTYTRD